VKTARITVLASIVIAACAFCTFTSAQVTEQADPVAPFLGRWDLTLKTSGHEYPSWIEIGNKDGNLIALFTGRWGNARPLPRITIRGKQITFVSPKEEEGSNVDITFEGVRDGESLSGTLNGPDGTAWSWTGVRAPSLDRSSPPKWDKPIGLLNGKDLSGWHESKAGPPDWTVKDGNLVSPGNGPELISDSKFQDFRLHIEFNCGKDANSGVYLRGRYEVQIETDSIAEPLSHHTGGVYGFVAPTPELPRSPDVWQSFDITLIGRKLKVIQNGRTIIDNQEIPGLTGGALDSREDEPGPIYLQGSEKGRVLFRNITIAPASQ
jgi:hypothetical protein